MKVGPIIAAAALFTMALASHAQAQVSDDAVRIGVLNDQSSVFADLAGPGSVIAAQMAVEDAGGTVLGKKIELVSADHQNKPDIALNIVRKWFDVDKVDAVVDLLNASVALAVQQVGKDKNKIIIGSSIGSSDFTGKACTPNSFVWTLDSYALSTALAKASVQQGLKSWFFIAVDYAFGHALLADGTRAVKEAGGSVIGSVRHPLGTSDFSSFLLQAQASGAQAVAFANAGNDFITATKQASEYGLTTRGQRLVAMVVYITDINSLGLKASQGLVFSNAFYWDRTDATREWSQRFFKRFNRMPTQAQASVYSSVRHYLKAVSVANTDDTQKVADKMRELPVDDFFGQGARVRKDGVLLHDMYLMEVKKPEESKGPWDYYKVLRTIPGKEAFRSEADSECPLLK